MSVTGIFRPTPSNGLSFRNRTLSNRVQAKKNRQHKGPSLIDRFAEALSKDGDVKRSAAAIGVSYSYGGVLLGKIKRELGWQAV